MEIGLITLVVADYDDAIAFYVDKVGFELVEDSPSATNDGAPKRWVVVRPPGAATGLLLAEPSSDDQALAVGNHAGGRIGLFLDTDDFERDHQRMVEAGVVFLEGPRREPYGTVAVWQDLYGNRWDLIEPAPVPASTAVTADADADDLPPYPPPEDLGEILLTEAEITGRITELGHEIGWRYRGEVPLLVAVLKGSMLFVSDLVRAIPGPLEIDFLAVSSYGPATRSSGVVRILKDLDQDIAGRHVIVVEDIVDSGLTLRFLLDHLGAQQPASLSTCSLVVRDSEAATALDVDYVGFHLPPAFVIGYGLDVNQRYRNLPYIAAYAGS